MAGIVRGELDGRPIMLENAATEATLEALLQATLANSSNKSQAAKIQKAYEEALKKTTQSQEKNLDSMKKQKKAIEDENKERESLNAKIKEEKEAREKLMSGLNELGALVGKGINVAFSTATPKISDFTGALSGIPIIGPIIGALGSAMQGQIDKFRELSQVGADFGGGIDNVRMVAAEAGLSLDTFTGAITANSKDLALLGGSASAGASIFVAVNKSLQGPFQKSLARLGFSMEETAEYTAGYLAQQTRLGLAQRMTQQELNKGSQDYLLELDKLARVHGMTRKEAQAALDAQTQDKRFKMFYAQLGTMGNETKSVMVGLEKANKGFADGMADLIMNNGVPSANNEMAKSIALNNPALVDLSRRLRAGSISQEEANKIIRQEAKIAGQKVKVDGKNMATFANLGSTVFDSIAALMSLTEYGGAAAIAALEQQKAMEESAKNQANLDKQLLDLRNRIMTALMPSFQLLTNMITNNTESIAKFITAIINSTEQFIKTVGDKGLGVAIGQALGDVVKSAVMSLFTSPSAVNGLLVAIGALLVSSAAKQMVVSKLADLLSDGGPGQRRGGRGGKLSGARGILGSTLIGGGLSMMELSSIEDSRKSGQITDAQATIESAGTVGGFGGAGAGAAMGAGFGAAFGGVGAIPGALIGGLLGYLGGSAGAKGLAGLFVGDSKTPAADDGSYDRAETARLKNKPGTASSTSPVSAELAQAAEVARVQTSAEVKAIAEALKTLDYGRLTVPEATIKSIDDGTNKLRFLRAEVNAMSESFKTLNNTGLDKITAGLGRLDESFKSFNKSFVEEFMTKFKELDKQSQETLLTNLNDKMDQLNISTSALVELTAENTKNGKNIVRNTQSTSGRVY